MKRYRIAIALLPLFLTIWARAGTSNEPSIFYLLANALRAVDRNEEAKAALHPVAELYTTSLEVDRRLHDAKVAGAR